MPIRPDNPYSQTQQQEQITPSTESTSEAIELQQNETTSEAEAVAEAATEKTRQPDYSVAPTAAELTQKHFNYAVACFDDNVGSTPNIYHLCSNHRAAVIANVAQVNSDNVALVDTHQCLLCQYPIA